ncbi:uncharacterized protein [Clytia hemisphaerica]
MFQLKFVNSFLLNFLLVTSGFGLDLKFTETFNDKRYTLYTYFRSEGLTELQCIIECTNDDECGSINHEQTQQFCELNQLMDKNHDVTNMESKQGWRHFIKSKKKTEAIPYKHEIIINEEMRPSRNRVLAIIPFQTDYWEVSFNFILEQDFPYWTNILRLSALEAGQRTTGWRIPGIYIFGRILEIWSSETEQGVIKKVHNLNLNQKYHLKVWQCVDKDDSNKVQKLIILDGEIISVVEHVKLITPFRNVQFFFGDVGYPPAPVCVSNLIYTPDLLYQGTSFPASSDDFILLKRFKRWPPGPNWLIRFYWLLRDKAGLKTDHWPKPLMIYKTINGKIHYLPMFQINKNTMSLYVYFSSNGNNGRRFTGVNLEPFFGGAPLQIKFRFFSHSDGTYEASLNVDGVATYTMSVDDYVEYEDVYAGTGASPDVDYVVSDLVIKEVV